MSTETNLNRNRFGAANQTTKENLFILSFTRFVLGSKRKEKEKPEKYAKLDINREEKQTHKNKSRILFENICLHDPMCEFPRCS